MLADPAPKHCFRLSWWYPQAGLYPAVHHLQRVARGSEPDRGGAGVGHGLHHHHGRLLPHQRLPWLPLHD
jgi:hypothetical protein